MDIFEPRCSQNMEKDRKLKDFHFLNVCEEGESPCMHALMIRIIKIEI